MKQLKKLKKMCKLNRCTECGKLLRTRNKSGLCNFHWKKKYYKMRKPINHKIHMKADLSRCPQESADFEKLVMTLVMRIQNRMIKKCTISSEEKVKGSTDIADIAVELKDGMLYYELQKELTLDYENKIARRDVRTRSDTIIIPLKPLIKKYGKLIKDLSKDLEIYLIRE